MYHSDSEEDIENGRPLGYNRNECSASSQNVYTKKLLKAAKRNDGEEAKSLLSRGARVDDRDRNNKTALYYALRNKNTELAKLLIKERARPEFQLYFTRFNWEENEEIIKFLVLNVPRKVLRYGPNFNTVLHLAVRRSKRELVRWLCKERPGLAYKKNSKNETPLDISVGKGDVETSGILVSELPDCLWVLNDERTSALHVAAARRSKSFIKALVPYCDIKLMNFPSWVCGTPLHCLVSNHVIDEELIRLFVENGADVNERCCKNENFDLEIPWSLQGWTPFFCLVCWRPSRISLIKTFIDLGADLGQKDYEGCNVLHRLTGSKSHPEYVCKAIDFLLTFSRDLLNSPDNRGNTPLHSAVIHRKYEVVKHLLKQGADPNSLNKWMGTPLHLAGMNGSVAMIRVLLKYGADVNLGNMRGLTAFFYNKACQKPIGRHPKVYSFLYAHIWAMIKLRGNVCDRIQERIEPHNALLENLELELDRLKKAVVGKGRISLYEVLFTKHFHPTPALDGYKINKRKLRSDFPYFCEFILVNLKRLVLVTELDRLSKTVSVGFFKLPAECLELIYAKLSNLDLRNLVDALK